MPSGGHNIKSLQKKIKEGTYRTDRDHAQKKVGNLIKEIPDPPDGLIESGRNAWYIICEDLINAGLLFSIDLVQLEILIYNIQDYWENEKELKMLKPGSIIEMDAEDFDRYKYLKTYNRQLLNVMRSMGNDFGLSPVARRSFSTRPQEADRDPILQLM